MFSHVVSERDDFHTGRSSENRNDAFERDFLSPFCCSLVSLFSWISVLVYSHDPEFVTGTVRSARNTQMIKT